MYLVAAPHPHKTDARQLIETAIAAAERLVTSAEVFQEILHRYVAIGRRDAIQPAFDVLLGVVDEVYPLEAADVERAKEILLARTGISARNAAHLAVMERRRVPAILSFDTGFDGIPGVTRLS